MFTHPHIGSQLARERQRDMLARADQQRLARPLRGPARASRRAAGTERRRRSPGSYLRTVSIGMTSAIRGGSERSA
jgi:hypothetical protein